MSMMMQTKDPTKTIPVTVGEVIGTTFVKYVDSGKHKLRMFPAYGIQKDVFDVLPSVGVDTIIIHEDHKRTYRISWEVWNTKSVVKNIGNGDQCFLSMKYMEETA